MAHVKLHRPIKTKCTTSSLEDQFLGIWEKLARGWPDPERQFLFHPIRRWPFDFAWPAYRVAVETEGGVMSFPVTCDKCEEPVERLNKRTNRRERVYAAMGRHTRSEGFRGDCIKYNAAAVLGWRVLRYTVKDLNERPAEIIEEITGLLGEGKQVDVDEQLSLFAPDGAEVSR